MRWGRERRKEKERKKGKRQQGFSNCGESTFSAFFVCPKNTNISCKHDMLQERALSSPPVAMTLVAAQNGAVRRLFWGAPYRGVAVALVAPQNGAAGRPSLGALLGSLSQPQIEPPTAKESGGGIDGQYGKAGMIEEGAGELRRLRWSPAPSFSPGMVIWIN